MRVARIAKFNNQQIGVISNSSRILNIRVSGVTRRPGPEKFCLWCKLIFCAKMYVIAKI